MDIPFEQQYSDNYMKVYNLSLGLTGNKSDAEEITQESFLRAFNAYEGFRGDSSFSTWIYRIALNVAHGYMKQRAKMPVQALKEDYGYNLEQILDDSDVGNPEILLLSKETRYKCLHCLTECLPGEQRQIFCLAITLGLPQRAVAEIMDCSLSKVKTTLHRAKKRWFGYMEDRCVYIKKTNPCRCSQWVRFAMQQGWIKPDETPAQPLPNVDLKALNQVRSLRSLRDVYLSLYPREDEQQLNERIKAGIRKREWSIIL